MSGHLYRVGDVVSLNFDRGQFFSKLNPFTVEAQLPHLGTKLQYRVKSRSENVRRVVSEDQLNIFGSQPNTARVIVLGPAAAGTTHAVAGTLNQTAGRS